MNIAHFPEINIDDWFSIEKYIPLTTNVPQSPYLHELLKIRMDSQYIYVLDMNGIERGLFVFDSQGNEYSHRKSLVDGKKKYYATSDFNIKGNKIYLSHESNNEILIFNSLLEYEKSVSLPAYEGIKNSYPIDTNSFFIRPLMYDQKELKSTLFYLDKNNELDPIKKFNNYVQVYYPLLYFENFAPSSNGDEILYFDLFSSDIWSISQNTAKLQYDINIDQKVWITEDEIVNLSKIDLPKRNKYLSEIKKAYYYDFVYDYHDFLLMSFATNGRRYFIFLNKDTKKISTGYLNLQSNLINPLDGSPSLNRLIGITATGDLIFAHAAELFKLYAETSNQKVPSKYPTDAFQYFKRISNKITPSCSQVLAIVKLKKTQ